MEDDRKFQYFVKGWCDYCGTRMQVRAEDDGLAVLCADCWYEKEVERIKREGDS